MVVYHSCLPFKLSTKPWKSNYVHVLEIGMKTFNINMSMYEHLFHYAVSLFLPEKKKTTHTHKKLSLWGLTVDKWGRTTP